MPVRECPECSATAILTCAPCGSVICAKCGQAALPVENLEAPSDEQTSSIDWGAVRRGLFRSFSSILLWFLVCLAAIVALEWVLQHVMQALWAVLISASLAALILAARILWLGVRGFVAAMRKTAKP